ncbi:hypothetical protein ECDEC3B_4608 [Escherichia coli DEC3B]|nr:hypothetical protein ECDEC3B_4608 [Escherichia coli DEC3B]
MNPLTLLAIQQQTAFTKKRQMAGDLGLRLVESSAEITDA